MEKVSPDKFFLCDGLKECRKSASCYMNGGDCKHTSTANHALYKDEPTVFETVKYNCTKEAAWEKEVVKWTLIP